MQFVLFHRIENSIARRLKCERIVFYFHHLGFLFPLLVLLFISRSKFRLFAFFSPVAKIYIEQEHTNTIKSISSFVSHLKCVFISFLYCNRHECNSQRNDFNSNRKQPSNGRNTSEEMIQDEKHKAKKKNERWFVSHASLTRETKNRLFVKRTTTPSTMHKKFKLWLSFGKLLR